MRPRSTRPQASGWWRRPVPQLHRGHVPKGRRTKTPGAVIAALVATALIGAACGSGSGGSATITLYNGQHEQTTNALVAAFEKQTGITVRVRNDDEAVLVNQIIAEGSASPADVIYTENSPALEQLQAHRLLAPVMSSTLAAVPSAYNSPRSDWVGVSARVSVLVYNTNQVNATQLPRSVMDLANSRWKGKLALAQGETDFQPIVTSIIKAHGTQAAARWLKAVKANAGSNVYPDNEAVTAQVNNGHATIGIIDSYYWYRERAQVGASNMHSAIATFSPGDAGYVVDVSGAAVLRSSAHRAAAQRFLAFLVSRQGQEIIAHGQSFEYPIGSGVTTAQPLQPFDSLRPAPLTIADLGDGSAAIALLQTVQLA